MNTDDTSLYQLNNENDQVPYDTCLYWLYKGHCIISRKVAHSIPDEVIELFDWQSFQPHGGPGPIAY
jgi:aminopeptidase-like protein